jgi:hypothetical protein
MREKLIKLLKDTHANAAWHHWGYEESADHLIANSGHIHSGYRDVGRPQTSFYDDDWNPPYWLDESENLSFEEDEITHWMPLPEPPKEG